jgi:hypothetical protein
MTIVADTAVESRKLLYYRLVKVNWNSIPYRQVSPSIWNKPAVNFDIPYIVEIGC